MIAGYFSASEKVDGTGRDNVIGVIGFCATSGVMDTVVPAPTTSRSLLRFAKIVSLGMSLSAEIERSVGRAKSQLET